MHQYTYVWRNGCCGAVCALSPWPSKPISACGAADCTTFSWTVLLHHQTDICSSQQAMCIIALWYCKRSGVGALWWCCP